MNTIVQQPDGLALKRQELFAARLRQKGLDEKKHMPIAPREPAPAYALSFAQQRLWFLHQLDPQSSAYHIPMALRLHGPLEEAALHLSLCHLVARHESLRTTFLPAEPHPLQRIHPPLPVPLPLIDLQAMPEHQRETCLQHLIQREGQLPFDLEAGPLLRARLLRLHPQEHVLLLTLHHIISDGWSMQLFTRELSLFYQAALHQRPCSLPPLAVQYADFALWQRRWLQGQQLDRHLDYWRTQLAGLPPLALPTDLPRPAHPTQRAAQVRLCLPPNLSQRLQHLSQRAGCTLFMTLLAAFQVLLARSCGQSDLAVGTPIANRTRAELEGVMGFFVNTLLLRSHLLPHLSFLDLLQQVKEMTLHAYAHQDLPFDKLVEALRPQRDSAQPPLLQVMFVLEEAGGQSATLEGLRLSPMALSWTQAKCDLTLLLSQREEGLECVLDYASELFTPAHMQRLLAHWQVLLHSICARPDRHLEELPILTDAELQQCLITWNDTSLDYPPDLCFHQLFEAQVARTPDCVALICQEQQLTYAEVNRRAGQLAGFLRDQGVRPEQPVGVLMRRSAELLLAMLGVLKAGGVYVPLDPAYPPERLSYMIQDAHICLLVTQHASQKQELLPASNVICLETEREALEQRQEETENYPVQSENTAYLIYTSGSTGMPKGTMVTHRNWVNSTYARFAAFPEPAFCLLSMNSFAFDASLGAPCWVLGTGGKVLVPLDEQVQSAYQLLDLCEQYQVTHVTAVSSLYMALIHEAEQQLATLRAAFIGGEAISPAFLTQHATRFPRVSIMNEYGPTEATIWASFAMCVPGTPISIGRPIANSQIYLLDAFLQPVSIGVPGELYIGGEGLARGYFQRPDLTAERFIPHLWSNTPGARLYRTGDLARYRADGMIDFIGRIDQQIKIRGFRIELEEIEAVLTQHPQISEAQLLIHEGESGNKRLTAFLLPKPSATLTATELRHYLKERLPEYMIPSTYVSVEAWPLLPNGKIDRKKLRTLDTVAKDQASIQPRDELEFHLWQIWQELLGIQTIGVLDDFFHLGGHSILAVRLFSRIRRQFNKELSLATLFRAPTIAELAQELRRQSTVSSQQGALVALQPQGALKPFFCVHPIGGTVFCYTNLARHLGAHQPFYALQTPDEFEAASYPSLEEMAAHYLVAIRSVQPYGPYLLGGWSFGGTVAFEMARQLHEQGERVELLALIDSFVHEPSPTFARPDLGDTALAEELAETFQITLPEGYASLTPEAQLASVCEQAKRINAIPLDADQLQVRRALTIKLLNLSALHNYVPGNYPGSITLLRATESVKAPTDEQERTDHAQHAVTAGWENLTSKSIEAHLIPGYHQGLVEEPAVRILAETLQTCFHEANRR